MAESESSAGDESTPMWSTLPKEVQLMVLSHLPIRSLCQMRCVCKEWRDVIRRRDFRTMYDNTESVTEAPRPAICYMESSFPARLEWSSYDYAARKWISMSSFTFRQRQTWPHSFYSVGGLLFLYFWKERKSGYMLGVSSWVVWQPFRNKWKKLPPCHQKLTDRETCFADAWVSDEQSKRYKLLMAHYRRRLWNEETNSNLVTEVYDSAMGCGRAARSIGFDSPKNMKVASTSDEACFATVSSTLQLEAPIAYSCVTTPTVINGTRSLATAIAT